MVSAITVNRFLVIPKTPFERNFPPIAVPENFDPIPSGKILADFPRQENLGVHAWVHLLYPTRSHSRRFTWFLVSGFPFLWHDPSAPPKKSGEVPDQLGQEAVGPPPHMWGIP